MSSKFSLGQCVATPGALAAIADNDQHVSMITFLARHQSGDWGDLSASDKRANEAALRDGSRILSAYHLSNGRKLWIITEAVNDDNLRASTCVLLPEEY